MNALNHFSKLQLSEEEKQSEKAPSCSCPPPSTHQENCFLLSVRRVPADSVGALVNKGTALGTAL